MNKLISIVVPCYNEEEVINTFHDRLVNSIFKVNYDFEIIYISDGSSDRTEEYIRAFIGNKSHQNIKTKLIIFSRNFGHQIAVTAGIDDAIGDAVILIDADLQDPPELIPMFIKEWNKGFQIIYGKRKKRKGESRFKLLSAKYFYKLLSYLSNVDIPVDTGDFRLMDKSVVLAIKKMPEKDRFLRGMIAWTGYSQVPLEYDRDKRYAGESKYPLYKMIKFASDGILSFSIKPLRLSTFIGLFCSLLSLVGIVYALIMWVYGSPVRGWTLIFISILFFSGVQLVSLGIIGEYIGRIFEQAKNRPLYVIKDKAGF